MTRIPFLPSFSLKIHLGKLILHIQLFYHLAIKVNSVWTYIALNVAVGGVGSHITVFHMEATTALTLVLRVLCCYSHQHILIFGPLMWY